MAKVWVIEPNKRPAILKCNGITVMQSKGNPKQWDIIREKDSRVMFQVSGSFETARVYAEGLIN